MKLLRKIGLILSLATIVSANHQFASSSECKSCHTIIYEEFTESMHHNATIFKDPIHKAVWDKHPKNRQAKKYVCGKCHTPTADNLSDMLSKDKQIALPDPLNATQEEAISCAYCHRIEKMKHGAMSNTNVISKREKHYFGNLKDPLPSEYHTVSTENDAFKNGNVCMGCHAHRSNSQGLNVCSTNDNNELDGANCITCHMPQVKGSMTSKSRKETHAFHGFPGSHFNQEMLSPYIDMKIVKQHHTFEIQINNKAPHAMLLHPLRLAQLRVNIERKGKVITLQPHVFNRVLGKEGKPTPPWIANSIVKDTMIKAKEKRTVGFDTELQSGDKVSAELVHFLVKPKAVKKFGLDDVAVAKRFYTLKKHIFIIK